MTTPFELVLDHRYADGAALDSSGFENHGRLGGAPRRVPVPELGTAALSFDGVRDRVVVPPSRSLCDMHAVRVDVTLRLDRLGGRRTIVEAYGAFALLFEPDGVLEGTIYNGSRWEGVRSGPMAVPVGRWVRLSWVYDGRDTSTLHLDDALLALDCRPLGQMEPVGWPFGLNVGGWPERDLRMFVGEIAHLRIWRRAA